MDQIETFRGLIVPRLNPQTQKEWCRLLQRSNECGRQCAIDADCIFDYERKDTLKPFNEWMETRKNGR
jgi:hypothetical protein